MLQKFLNKNIFFTSVSGRDFSDFKLKNEMTRQLVSNAKFLEQWQRRAQTDCEKLCNISLKRALLAISHNRRSAAFITAHWGNYVKSFVDVAFSMPDGTKFVTLRGEQWNADEDIFWASLNSASDRSVRVFQTNDGQKSVMSIAKSMKQGAHLFMLFDLFNKFGKVSPVHFFDSTLKLTLDWTRLCYRSKSVVVIIAPSSLERGETEILQVFDPQSFPDQHSFSESCAKAASQCLMSLIRENPAYWFMWEHMDKYTQHE